MKHHLVPDNAPDFLATRRAEHKARCESFAINLLKCDLMLAAMREANWPDDTKAERLAQVRGLRWKLQMLHHAHHECYPFSIN